ncbi:MAG: hypothetical protein KBT88_01330 [Gammaproteobacteria bacterium]|nr:hypothetical protein [Gammaproteobacteria bacterium]MBQ0838397.1 hypothetical protein [Gammaproteobacteria bacterium]
MIKNMKLLRALTMTAALLLCQPAWSHEANPHGPSGIDMAADLLVGRPVLLATTIVGSVIWLVALPFSALGGNVQEATDALVIGPAKATFVRCLGCPSNAYQGEQ